MEYDKKFNHIEKAPTLQGRTTLSLQVDVLATFHDANYASPPCGEAIQTQERVIYRTRDRPVRDITNTVPTSQSIPVQKINFLQYDLILDRPFADFRSQPTYRHEI